MEDVQTVDLIEQVTVEKLRAVANVMFQVTAWAMTTICTSVAWLGGRNTVMFFALSSAGALGVNLAVARYGTRSRARFIVAVCIAFQAMVIIYAAYKLSAAFVQEAHMFYYVLNCMLLAYLCWRTLALYNFVAISWLSLSTFIAPEHIWSHAAAPNGVYHLTIHVLIAVVLVGPLVFAAEKLRSTFSRNEKAVRDAFLAIDEARASVGEADREREGANNATERVGRVAGDIEGQLQKLFANILESARDAGRSAHAVAMISRTCGETTSAVETLFDRTTSNIEEVAGAADSLSLSVVEVADRAAAAARKAQDAVDESVQISRLVEALEGSSQQVDDITRIIRKVAASINLLALNATLEAARAGNAGRGFAVVAQNVKMLAGQTSKATEDIASLITIIQNETRDAVQTIKGIGETIRFAHEHALDIAVSTALQTTMTASIVDTASSTANEASKMRSRLKATQTMLASARSMSDDLIGASDGLGRMTETSTVRCASLLEALHYA